MILFPIHEKIMHWKNDAENLKNEIFKQILKNEKTLMKN